MATEIKCDMTGKPVTGDGVKSIAVQVTDKLRLQITPQLQTGINRYAQAVLCDDAAEKITAALGKLAKVKEAQPK